MGISENYGKLYFGELLCGEQNSICDVPGVLVGHKTLAHEEIQTGVTAVLPHGGNLFRDKVPAAVHVINGFGKTAGSIQISELGTLETPILLTNTLSVGTVSDALVRYMLRQNPEIGVDTGTVNPVVLECNDGYLNDIRSLSVTVRDVEEALNSASVHCEEGAVGAGRGMSCFGLKGGIGTASRVLEFDGVPYTMGVLVLTNFGSLEDFTICGNRVGEQISLDLASEEDKGSIIVLLGTDLPLSARQLSRVARRAAVGISRTGGLCGNGSGEIALAFSTAQYIPHESEAAVLQLSVLSEACMNQVFRAAAFATEEAIISSMLHAETVEGRAGNTRRRLLGFWP